MLLKENAILVPCETRHADFDELFRILKSRNFLGHFGILSSWEFPTDILHPFSDIFTHGSIFRYLACDVPFLPNRYQRVELQSQNNTEIKKKQLHSYSEFDKSKLLTSALQF